jgi:hypothetical protein
MNEIQLLKDDPVFGHEFGIIYALMKEQKVNDCPAI